MWEAIKRALLPEDARMILDAWNGDSDERRRILYNLRRLGAERVVAWYFTTPVEVLEEWFWKKPDVARLSEMRNRLGEGLAFYGDDRPRRDNELFHVLASGIDSDGFDAVLQINPVVTGPELVLRLANRPDLTAVTLKGAD